MRKCERTSGLITLPITAATCANLPKLCQDGHRPFQLAWWVAQELQEERVPLWATVASCSSRRLLVDGRWWRRLERGSFKEVAGLCRLDLHAVYNVLIRLPHNERELGERARAEC